MSVHDVPVRTLDGKATTLAKNKVLLIVNVASKCGFTPQYKGLQELHDKYAERGFSVVGVPCNQFGAQEPGSAEEIREFCSTNYGVSFPLLEKTDVNGKNRHALYQELTAIADGDGKAGDVMWNFEKFLVAPDGTVVQRFRSQTGPEDEQLPKAIETQLP